MPTTVDQRSPLISPTPSFVRDVAGSQSLVHVPVLRETSPDAPRGVVDGLARLTPAGGDDFDGWPAPTAPAGGLTIAPPPSPIDGGGSSPLSGDASAAVAGLLHPRAVAPVERTSNVESTDLTRFSGEVSSLTIAPQPQPQPPSFVTDRSPSDEGSRESEAIEPDEIITPQWPSFLSHLPEPGKAVEVPVDEAPRPQPRRRLNLGESRRLGLGAPVNRDADGEPIDLPSHPPAPQREPEVDINPWTGEPEVLFPPEPAPSSVSEIEASSAPAPELTHPPAPPVPEPPDEPPPPPPAPPAPEPEPTGPSGLQSVMPVYRPAPDSPTRPLPVKPSEITVHPVKPRTERVPDDMRQSLRQVHGIDVGDTPIRRGPEVSHQAKSMGARAFAKGGEVFLPAEEGSLDEPQTKGLLAHELTHIVQQRTLGTMPSEDSFAGRVLEESAQQAERYFRGDAGAASPTPLTHAPVPPSIKLPGASDSPDMLEVDEYAKQVADELVSKGIAYRDSIGGLVFGPKPDEIQSAADAAVQRAVSTAKSSSGGPAFTYSDSMSGGDYLNRLFGGAGNAADVMLGRNNAQRDQFQQTKSEWASRIRMAELEGPQLAHDTYKAAMEFWRHQYALADMNGQDELARDCRHEADDAERGLEQAKNELRRLGLPVPGESSGGRSGRSGGLAGSGGGLGASGVSGGRSGGSGGSAGMGSGRGGMGSGSRGGSATGGSAFTYGDELDADEYLGRVFGGMGGAAERFGAQFTGLLGMFGVSTGGRSEAEIAQDDQLNQYKSGFEREVNMARVEGGQLSKVYRKHETFWRHQYALASENGQSGLAQRCLSEADLAKQNAEQAEADEEREATARREAQQTTSGRTGDSAARSAAAGGAAGAAAGALAGAAVGAASKRDHEELAAEVAAHLDIDDLAKRLYTRIRSQLRTELLVDRERAGMLTDFR